MKAHTVVGRHIFLSPSPTQSLPLPPPRFNFKHAVHPTIRCASSDVPSSSSSSSSQLIMETQASKSEYNPNLLDEMFLTLFRNKMVKEVGWDSGKPGYDGLIEVANQLMIRSPNNAQAAESAVRILISLFPPFLPQLFKMLIAPLANGKPAAIMVARVTQLSCQWLMGTCKVNSIQLQDGSSWETGVLVEKCKYLEESKCVGICINTCKLPTQTFIKDYMGVPLVMEPDFSDYSCQFKFGVLPPIPAEDKALSEPCLEICPNATRRRELNKTGEMMKCPKV